jgi:predicted flap endonuclease-1-like 5' DNA nuclease
MMYLLNAYWIPALLAGLLGLIVGWMTCNGQRLTGWFSGWVPWGMALAAIAGIAAYTGQLAGKQALLLETGLMMLCSYLLGCCLGCMLKPKPAPHLAQATASAAKSGKSGTGKVVAATAAGAGATAAGLAAAKKTQSGASTSAVSVKPATAATSTPASTAAASSVAAKSGTASTASSLASTGTTDTTGKVAGAKAVDAVATSKSLDSKASDLANGSTVKIVTALGAAATGAVATAAATAGKTASTAAASVTTATAKVVEPIADAVKAEAGKRDAGKDANLKVFTAAPKFGVRPELYNAPRGGKGDELSLIWGVAEKLEHKMNAAGIWHFDQIAHWTEANVEWFEHEFEGFKGRLSRDKWIEQCKKLAAGWRPEGHVGQRPKG